MGESVIIKRLTTIIEISTIMPVDVNVAIEAAKSYEELKQVAKRDGLRDPSLFDAIVLAVTRVLKANVLTGDEHFKNLPETVWIGD